MNEPVPFTTDDAVLAASLYAAGIPEACTPTHTFTAEILQRLGYRGVPLIEAARTAWKRGDRGKVHYYFELSPFLEPLLEAYKDQCDQINAAGEEADVGEALREIMRRAAGRFTSEEVNNGSSVTLMDEREALLRISTITLKCRIGFVNRWKDQVPRLHIPAGGEARSIGNGATLYPGYKNVPVNATPEQLAKLGL